MPNTFLNMIIKELSKSKRLLVTCMVIFMVIFRRLRGKTHQEKKTSEALEIERIKKLQEETKKRLKSNESYLHKALAPQPVHQAKLATEVTKTIEFNFATDSRMKQHPMKTRGEKSENASFVGQLRKHPPSPVSIFINRCNFQDFLFYQKLHVEPLEPLHKYVNSR